MTDQDRIRLGDTLVALNVRRSARRKKTVQILVEADGIHVIAPKNTPTGELEAIVRRRARWILTRLSEEQLAAEPKRFLDGDTLPYLGRDVPIAFKPAESVLPVVKFVQQRFEITEPMDLDGEARAESIRQAMIAWCRARAAERFSESVERWRPRLSSRSVPRVIIRDQRRRWGSCALDGTLRFSWRAIMLAPDLLEYIVVHELAHLTISGHSKEFWALVIQAIPDAQQRRRRLRETGRALPF